MEIMVSQQAALFGASCLLGVLLGALYDVFRILRIALPASVWIVTCEDLLYFALCAVASFLFVLTENSGQLRWFILVGELLGALVYHCSVGRVVIGLSRQIIALVRTLLRLLDRLFLLPIRLVFRLLAGLLGGIWWLFLSFLKKTVRKWKYRLKPLQCMLYNDSVKRKLRYLDRRENDAKGKKKKQAR